MSTLTYNPPRTGIGVLRESWSWFLLLGIALMLLGVVDVIWDVAATHATIVFLGWLLLVGGVFQLVHTLRTGRRAGPRILLVWGGFFLYLLSALFRGVIGFLLIRHPAAGAESLTLLVGLFFLVGGLFRVIGSATAQFPRWGWAVLSGAISVILGVMVLSNVPSTSLWFIGFALGVDLIFDGFAIFNLAIAVHRLPALEAS